MSTSLIKLAICEDERSYRKLLGDYFDGLTNYEVRLAADITELCDLLASWTPDVVLTDLYFREVPEYSAARRIRELAPGARVIMLTYSSYEGDVRRVLEGSGLSAVEGYLTKNIDPSEMDRAIRLILSGQRYIDPLAAARAIPDPERDLTRSERRVLQGLADGSPLSEIAQMLPRSAKTGRPVGERQVRRLTESAREKLGARTVQEAISVAHRRRLIT
jgi:two-component system, NarL family, response regulator DesR